jgi:hypothetical protein
VKQEGVGGRRELGLVEETGRRTIVLAEIVDDTIAVKPEPIGEDLRRVSGLALIARKDAADIADPRARSPTPACGSGRAS